MTLYDQSQLDSAQTIVLNALIEYCTDNQSSMDTESMDLLEKAYQSALGGEERQAFEETIKRLANVEHGEFGGLVRDVYDPVQAVTHELADKSIIISLQHTIEQEFVARDAAVYTLLRGAGPDLLSNLKMSNVVVTELCDGIDALHEGQPERAEEEFSRAIDEAKDENSQIAALVMAGWAAFLTDRDDDAQSYSDKALRLDSTSWAAKLVWISATHERRERIRSGDLTVGIVLRWVAEIPEESSLIILRGEPERVDGQWTEISSEGESTLLNRVTPVTSLRFEISGTVNAFPAVQSYYLGLGVYDHRSEKVKEVERMFLTGPGSTEPIESLSFRSDE